MSIFKQSAIILLQNWLLIPLSFATNVMVARVLGPEGKGVLLLLAGMSGVLSSLFSLGLPTAAAYYSRKEGYTMGQILGVCLAIAVSTTALAVLIFRFFSDDFIRIFLGSTENIVIHPYWIWIVLAGLLPGIISVIGDSLLIVNAEMKYYVVKHTGGSLLHIILTWLFVLILSRGVPGELWAQLISLVAQVGVFIYWLSKKAAWKGLAISLKNIRFMLHIGLQQYGISLVALVSKRFDIFLIASVLNVKDAGYFSIPYLLYNISMGIPQSVMWPLVSKLTGGAKKDGFRHLTTATRIQLFIMFTIALVAGLTAHLWVRILFGEAFLPSVSAIWVILPTLIAAPITISGNAYLTSRGEPGRVILPGIVATLTQVVISISLVPRIGIVGSALGLTVQYIFVATWMAIWLVKNQVARPRELLLITRDDLQLILNTVLGQIKRFPLKRETLS